MNNLNALKSSKVAFQKGCANIHSHQPLMSSFVYLPALLPAVSFIFFFFFKLLKSYQVEHGRYSVLSFLVTSDADYSYAVFLLLELSAHVHLSFEDLNILLRDLYIHFTYERY